MGHFVSNSAPNMVVHEELNRALGAQKLSPHELI